MENSLRVLMITSEWPTREQPHLAPFIVRQVNFLRKAGVDVDVFTFRGKKNPANYARAWLKAQKLIMAGRHHLVHAQWGQSGFLALPRRKPLVVTFRGDDLEGSIGPNGKKETYGVVLRQVSRLVARSADQVILVSKNLSRSLGRADYSVIPSGIDLSLFTPSSKSEARKKLGLDQEGRYVLFAGSPKNPTKRYDLARDAVSLLPQDLPVQLIVASGINHECIPDYMNAANVLLLTSLHEGSPNVVKEALACNMPVISTDVGDVRERIQAIDGCEIADDDTPRSVALALEKALRRSQPINGREQVLALDERIITDKVIQVYKRAITEDRKNG